MYVVTNDEPYYPRVYYFDSLSDAIEKQQEMLDYLKEYGCNYDLKVVVAKIVRQETVKEGAGNV